MLSEKTCPDTTGKSRLPACPVGRSAAKAGFAGKTLFTFFVFIFLLTTAKAQEIDVTLSATGGFSVIDFDGTPTLFRILGNGKVGIGTTSPQNLLDIEGSMVIGAGYSGTNTAPANGLLVEGRVGLGALSPKNKLDIEGGAVIGAVYSGQFTAPANGLLVQGNVGIGDITPDGKLEVRQTGTADIFNLYDNTTNVFTVQDGGNVGIGTTSPLSLLDIRGTDAIMELSGDLGDKEGLAFQIDYENVNTSSRIFFRENNTQKHGTSFIHAGLADPVFDGTTFTGLPTNAFHIVTHNESFEGSVVMTFLKVNANVGIGTTAPSQKLDVNGNARFRSIGSGASVGALHYTTDGTLTTNTSDRRLKENIQPLSGSLNKVLQMQGVMFNWKEDTRSQDRIGLIAQEVEQVVPELVFQNPNDGYYGVRYSDVSAILVEAIKEQQKQIEELKRRINSLTLKENNKTSYGYTKTNMNK